MASVVGDELSNDKESNRNNHENGWYAKGQWVTVRSAKARDILPENGRDKGGNETTRVNGHVEERKETLQFFRL